MKSLDELLSPIEGEAGPCGPDMGISPEFDAIDGFFKTHFKVDAKVTNRDDAPDGYEHGDWDELIKDIEGLFDLTKDINFAVFYAKAGVVLGDLSRIDLGLKVLASLLEDNWEGVNPTIEVGDFIARANACQNITAYNEFALPFHEIKVFETPRSDVTIEQVFEAHDHGSAFNNYPLVVGVIEEIGTDAVEETIGQAVSIIDGFERISKIMNEHGGSEAPDFSTSKDVVEKLKTSLEGLAGLNTGEAGADVSDTQEGSANGASSRSFTGKISSRDDVVQALKDIETYYAMAEPRHPVKVASERMRLWVHKGFMEILEDISPRSVDEAKTVLLPTPREEN